MTCGSVAEAEFERARMVLVGEGDKPGRSDGSTTLETFWRVWLSDAKGRLAEGTVGDYEYLWRRRVRPRFGVLAMKDITPRAVSQWKAAMSAEGVGSSSRSPPGTEVERRQIVRWRMNTFPALAMPIARTVIPLSAFFPDPRCRAPAANGATGVSAAGTVILKVSPVRVRRT